MDARSDCESRLILFLYVVVLKWGCGKAAFSVPADTAIRPYNSRYGTRIFGEFLWKPDSAKLSFAEDDWLYLRGHMFEA